MLKIKKIKISLIIVFLLLFLQANFIFAQEDQDEKALPQSENSSKLLKFEQIESLDSIRSKIKQNGYNFTVDHNWVYDMSPEEKSKFFSRKPSQPPKNAPRNYKAFKPSKKFLPSSFDWRSKDGHTYIGPVRNQGGCGSCYAFGATAAAEGNYNMRNNLYDGNAIDFSEAYIAFCLRDYYPGFDGCDGANYDYEELTALTERGIALESCFPYTDSDPGACQHGSCPVSTFNNWGRVGCGDIDAIKQAIMTYGVVDAAVYVTDAFSSYSSGIFNDTSTSCSSNPCYYTATNHAIALVGWDDNNGNGYWILRNSWGASWGENGYMRISYQAARVACEVCYLDYQPIIGPIVTINQPSGVTCNSAVLSGSVNPQGKSTTYYFEYGPTTSYGYKTSNQSAGSGTSSVNVSASLTNLSGNSTYHCRLVAINSDGTNSSSDISFISQTSSQEGFEEGKMPPTNWTLTQNNPNETWFVSTEQPYSGTYHANIFYDDNLVDQDEIIFSPGLDSNITSLEFWSYGSVYWGVTNDNYDLEVWIVKGAWDAGSGDDIKIKNADNDWSVSYEYAKTQIDLTPYNLTSSFKIAFRYKGVDGAEASIDNISFIGSCSTSARKGMIPAIMPLLLDK
ncbi:MAG: hypothetical protein HQK76_10985 [Desulfobacterales bacterium]|nr:hypothetical protein [Desulfobacterales bacterium]